MVTSGVALGERKEETDVTEADKHEREESQKKSKMRSQSQPIRRSSRKLVLMKTKSIGVVTRSHRKQNGQKQSEVNHASQPPHKNGNVLVYS